MGELGFEVAAEALDDAGAGGVAGLGGEFFFQKGDDGFTLVFLRLADDGAHGGVDPVVDLAGEGGELEVPDGLFAGERAGHAVERIAEVCAFCTG